MRKLFGALYSDASVNIAMLLLRLVLGLIMMVAHGFDKLKNFGTKSHSFSDPFHVGSVISFSTVVFAEFFCSFLIILGLLTRLACVPLILVMSVALYTAHHAEIFGGGERAALYLTGYLVLLLIGPGKISMDRLIGR